MLGIRDKNKILLLAATYYLLLYSRKILVFPTQPIYQLYMEQVILHTREKYFSQSIGKVSGYIIIRKTIGHVNIGIILLGIENSR